jgi:hypothetical protein
MSRYCFYTLLDCNTIADTPKEIECASDKDAIAKANELLAGLDVEVCRGPRIIIQAKADPP